MLWFRYVNKTDDVWVCEDCSIYEQKLEDGEYEIVDKTYSPVELVCEFCNADSNDPICEHCGSYYDTETCNCTEEN